MKYILFLLLLFTTISCPGSNESTQKEAEKEFIKGLPHNPLFYLWILGQRINSRESPRCGGDAIGTALGYNTNLPAYPKLEENQEITSAYFNSIVYEYQATRDSNITITILEKIKIDTTSSINCSNSNKNRISIKFCNGKIPESLDSHYMSGVAIGQIYSKSFSFNVKYFLNIYSEEKECNLKINIKSNTL
jgi:hypothetical protein